MSNTVKIMSGDLFISQNPRSFYTSVQVLRPDDLPNSNQINIRFEVKWMNRKGETKCFSEYKQNIKMWILKNDARRFPNQERPAERTHIIGYVPDQLPWNDLSPPMTGLYRERSPLGRNAVVLEKDHIADVARREVLIADLNLKNACLCDELTARDEEIARLQAKNERFWAALDSIGMEIDSLPSDNEYGARISVHQMQRQAPAIVKEEIKALKGPEA